MNFNNLNRFFTRKNLMNSLRDVDFNKQVYVENVQNNYSIITKHYRNEFFYKNTLFNKIVLGKYSLSTTTAYSEMKILSSKADYVIINHDNATVYEVKTDLDNLERLVYQLEDYSKAFNNIYVVTSENFYYPVYREIKNFSLNVGIIVLTGKETLSIRNKHVSDSSKLTYEGLFKLLRKYEYEEILNHKFGGTPNVSPVRYFKESLHWFKKIDILEAQRLVFQKLFTRKDVRDNNLIKEIPYELRWLAYNQCNNEKELENIVNILRRD